MSPLDKRKGLVESVEHGPKCRGRLAGSQHTGQREASVRQPDSGLADGSPSRVLLARGSSFSFCFLINSAGD